MLLVYVIVNTVQLLHILCFTLLDVSLDEEFLFGSLCITIDTLQGLKEPLGSINFYLCHHRYVIKSKKAIRPVFD